MTHHNHQIHERFRGSRKAASAKKLAAKHGWTHQIVKNANGCSGMYARTDAIITRPMTEIEAADHMRQIRLRRLASSLMRDANLAITEKEINRLISRAEFAKLDDVRGALRNRKKEIVALGSEFSRLGVFHRLYNSGLSSLARRQIDLAIKHGVTTFAGLRDFAGVHAADRTCRGTACQELIDRMK